LDLSGDISWAKDKFGIYLFANRYSTSGYDLSPEAVGPTVSPFYTYTLNSKVTYKFSSKTDLSLSGRYFNEEQNYQDEVLDANNEVSAASTVGNIKEWNVNPVLTHRFSNRLKTIARFYSTQYKTESSIYLDGDGSIYYHDDFKQTFTRPELNAEYFINDKNTITVGGGTILESVQTSRYGDSDKRKQQTSYGFFQYEWQPVQKLNVIAGGRFDHNSIYGSQFSPKLSAQYELNDRITLKASAGRGFKAPDFRQLYLNFNNTAGGGYSVLGTEVVVDRLRELEAQGKIQTYLYDSALIGELEAERSAAINVGGKVKITSRLSLDLNGFYNSINNQIESQPVALTTNNQTIYSYRNISRSFTSGFESNFSYNLIKNVSLSLGYQLLYAMDKDVNEAIKNGEVFARDPNTGATRRLDKGDYFGLYNRSRHTGNFKIFYSHPVTKWEGSLRVIYRGKFGVNDINSNAILDKYDDFVEGYASVNLSVAKTINPGIRLQVGVDNLFNYTNTTYLPNVPGRLVYGSIGYTFSKNDKSN
ncbi:MAG TPA: TonB-dependent receptor, partial [Cyclobacteriaceae bacterium]